MKGKFEKLYEAYYDSLYRYIYASVKDKWNTEDIISIVLMNIYNVRHKIQEVETSRNWVFKIAHNAVIDFYRRNKKKVYVEEYLDTGEEDGSLEEILIKDEFNKIKLEIEKLPEEMKQIIYMRYYGDLKYREIAEIIERPEGSVKSVLFRALEKVRKSYSFKEGGNVYEK